MGCLYQLLASSLSSQIYLVQPLVANPFNHSSLVINPTRNERFMVSITIAIRDSYLNSLSKYFCGYWETTEILNLACTGRCMPGFLKLILCGLFVCVRVCVCVCLCPPLRLLVIHGVIWTPYGWLNKFYSCHMATVAVITNGHGFGIDTPCGN